MTTQMKRIPARTTELQRTIVDCAGPIGAATRALLWLGAAAGGLPIPPAGRREIASLLVEDLSPTVLVALQRLYDSLGDAVESTVVQLSTRALPHPVESDMDTTPLDSSLSSSAQGEYGSDDLLDNLLDDDPFGTGRTFDG